MLINIFSLPRTGSTWWCHYLINQLTDSLSIPKDDIIFLNETFNVTHYKIYNKQVNRWVHQAHYSPGCFWELPDPVMMKTKRYYSEISIDSNSRGEQWITFIQKATRPIVCHTHLLPIHRQDLLNTLYQLGDSNYYLARENILEQLASFVVMVHTGQWIQWSPLRIKIKFLINLFFYNIVDYYHGW